ncbi:hypothetical protein C8Q74DRAFT_1218828 [Fomes fomentarius]|nr:hypothetical protein C8Q74DRAFT_1218828 [Fomes fomentarius]
MTSCEVLSGGNDWCIWKVDMRAPPNPPLKLERVDCTPWPPPTELSSPRSSGRFFYGIYLRQGERRRCKTTQSACRPSSRTRARTFERCTACTGSGSSSGRNPSMDYSFVQLAAVRRRHKEAMPFLAEDGAALVLYLFPWSWRNLERRPSQALVQRLVNALDCEPDWWDVAA